MLKLALSCLSCGYHAIVKNGKTRHSQHPRHLLQVGETAQRSVSQNYKCNDCGRQFVENPKWRRISQETKKLIDRYTLR